MGVIKWSALAFSGAFMVTTAVALPLVILPAMNKEPEEIWEGDPNLSFNASLPDILSPVGQLAEYKTLTGGLDKNNTTGSWSGYFNSSYDMESLDMFLEEFSLFGLSKASKENTDNYQYLYSRDGRTSSINDYDKIFSKYLLDDAEFESGTVAKYGKYVWLKDNIKNIEIEYIEDFQYEITNDENPADGEYDKSATILYISYKNTKEKLLYTEIKDLHYIPPKNSPEDGKERKAYSIDDSNDKSDWREWEKNEIKESDFAEKISSRNNLHHDSDFLATEKIELQDEIDLIEKMTEENFFYGQTFVLQELEIPTFNKPNTYFEYKNNLTNDLLISESNGNWNGVFNSTYDVTTSKDTANYQNDFGIKWIGSNKWGEYKSAVLDIENAYTSNFDDDYSIMNKELSRDNKKWANLDDSKGASIDRATYTKLNIKSSYDYLEIDKFENFRATTVEGNQYIENKLNIKYLASANIKKNIVITDFLEIKKDGTIVRSETIYERLVNSSNPLQYESINKVEAIKYIESIIQDVNDNDAKTLQELVNKLYSLFNSSQIEWNDTYENKDIFFPLINQRELVHIDKRSSSPLMTNKETGDWEFDFNSSYSADYYDNPNLELSTLMGGAWIDTNSIDNGYAYVESRNLVTQKINKNNIHQNEYAPSSGKNLTKFLEIKENSEATADSYIRMYASNENNKQIEISLLDNLTLESENDGLFHINEIDIFINKSSKEEKRLIVRKMWKDDFSRIENHFMIKDENGEKWVNEDTAYKWMINPGNGFLFASNGKSIQEFANEVIKNTNPKYSGEFTISGPAFPMLDNLGKPDRKYHENEWDSTYSATYDQNNPNIENGPPLFGIKNVIMNEGFNNDVSNPGSFQDGNYQQREKLGIVYQENLNKSSGVDNSAMNIFGTPDGLDENLFNLEDSTFASADAYLDIVGDNKLYFENRTENIDRHNNFHIEVLDNYRTEDKTGELVSISYFSFYISLSPDTEGEGKNDRLYSNIYVAAHEDGSYEFKYSTKGFNDLEWTNSLDDVNKAIGFWESHENSEVNLNKYWVSPNEVIMQAFEYVNKYDGWIII